MTSTPAGWTERTTLGRGIGGGTSILGPLFRNNPPLKQLDKRTGASQIKLDYLTTRFQYHRQTEGLWIMKQKDYEMKWLRSVLMCHLKI